LPGIGISVLVRYMYTYSGHKKLFKEMKGTYSCELKSISMKHKYIM
jgi:hypothetical protein